MLSHKGEEAVTVEAGFTVAEVFTVAVGSEVFTAEAFTVGVGSEVFVAEAFMVGADSQVFMAEAFMVGADSQVFTGAILDTFTAVDSRGFMAIIVSAMIGFSFPVSTVTRGGGVGVIRIRIGVTRITPTILTTLTTLTIRISRSRRVPRGIYLASLRRFLPRVFWRDAQCDLRSCHNAPADKRNHNQISDTQNVFAPAKRLIRIQIPAFRKTVTGNDLVNRPLVFL
jgi:hypothetical protein